jgi:hypothetical protein
MFQYTVCYCKEPPEAAVPPDCVVWRNGARSERACFGTMGLSGGVTTVLSGWAVHVSLVAEEACEGCEGWGRGVPGRVIL